MSRKPKLKTPASQLKAASAHHDKLKAEGFRKVTIWLSAPASERLDELAEEHGSKAKALEALLTR